MKPKHDDEWIRQAKDDLKMLRRKADKLDDQAVAAASKGDYKEAQRLENAVGAIWKARLKLKLELVNALQKRVVHLKRRGK